MFRKPKGRQSALVVDPSAVGKIGAPGLDTGRISTDDVNRATVWPVPSNGERKLAHRSGKLDGKRGLQPDPATGHFPTTERFQAAFRGAVANHRKVLERRLSGIDELDQALAEEARQLDVLTAEFDPPAEQHRNPQEDIRARRARRSSNAHRAQLIGEQERRRRRVEEILRERARLAEQRAHQIHLTAQHCEVARQHWQQLVSLYWTSLLRAHPDADELRRAYAVPLLTVGDAPSAGDHIPGSTVTLTKGL